MRDNSQIRIFTLYPYPKPGGCFRQLLRAVEGFIEEGYEVHYLSAKKFPLKDNENLIFHRFPIYFKNEILFYFFFYSLSPLLIFFIVLKNRISKIIVFNEEFAALCFLAKILGVKATLIIEGFMRAFVRSKRLNFIVYFILFLYGRVGIIIADSAWAVSRDLKKKISKFYRTRKTIGLRYNLVLQREIEQAKNIDLKNDLGLDKNSFLIGCLSSFIPRKNISYLIEEFSSVSTKKVVLLLAGSGAEEKRLRGIVDRLGLGERILFLGERKDSLNIIKSIDLLILPTLHDDCPLVLIEALNLDTPCLASKRGGIPEILHYEELMFDPEEKGALKKKIEKILRDKDHFELIKKHCLERKSHFNKDWAREILRIIEKV